MDFWRNSLADPLHYDLYVVALSTLLHKNHSDAGLRDYFSKNPCSNFGEFLKNLQSNSVTRLLIRQKLVENSLIGKLKCDNFGDVQTM